MFDNLSEKLQRVFKNLRGEGKLSAENMEAALREIRVALLEADVNFKVVKQLIENIKVKAMGEEVLTALSPSQQVIKIVQRGADQDPRAATNRELRFANEPPSVFLIVGLQGSGKTTSTGKLARWLTQERPPADDGFGGRLPSGGAGAAASHRARDRAADLRRRAGGDAAARSGAHRRGAKRPTTAATCCWWIPPDGCISTIS